METQSDRQTRSTDRQTNSALQRISTNNCLKDGNTDEFHCFFKVEMDRQTDRRIYRQTDIQADTQWTYRDTQTDS